jgi:hypothetical protein
LCVAKRRKKHSANRGLTPAAKPKPLAPIVSRSTSEPLAEANVGDGYRDAIAAPEKPLRPPSDIPESPGAKRRTTFLFAATWIVLVVRFAIAVRAHGTTMRAFKEGFFGSLVILPLAIGLVLLVVRDK